MEVFPPKIDGSPVELASFEGMLPCVQAVRVRITIRDWDFVNIPQIEILSDPDGFRPHVSSDNRLCYLGHGQRIFDRHEPVANLKACLDLAVDELNRQAQPGYRDEESRYEFIRYWSGGVDCLLGTVKPDKSLYKTKLAIFADKYALITDKHDEIAKVRASINQELPSNSVNDVTHPAWVITLEQYPWLDRNGVPKTWSTLWDWLKMVDQKGRDRLASLVCERDFANTDLASIVFRYQNTWFGVHVSLPKEERSRRTLIPLRRHGGHSSMRHYLEKGDGSKQKVKPFAVTEIISNFIHERNLDSIKSLLGLKIKLIGAGAIGGFLAQQLVRLGAGSDGGELIIIDKDLLGSENLGRHVLGLNKIFQAKAAALSSFLTKQFPLSTITGVIDDVMQVIDLFDCDLVIDATGEEDLSLVLNEMHQEHILSHPDGPPMLFVWVVGNGEVVQALLSDGGNSACYDCLNLTDRDGLERQRYKVLKELPKNRFIGCHTMRPYAVSAPTAAAALAGQMVADWNDGRPKPRFRTLFLGRGPHIGNIKPDNDPDRLHGCRTCSRT